MSKSEIAISRRNTHVGWTNCGGKLMPVVQTFHTKSETHSDKGSASFLYVGVAVGVITGSGTGGA